MLLGLRTDSSSAELYLFDIGGSQIASKAWQADRTLARWLLKNIDDFLHENATSKEALKGIFVFEGPGSFTGLRIGITVANALATSLNIPIIGERTDDWVHNSVERLVQGRNDQIVLPFYGADARITQPKK